MEERSYNNNNTSSSNSLRKNRVRKYNGSRELRQKIICSLLSSSPIIIQQIRSVAPPIGLQPFEASLLRLINRVTNGTKIEINETGTRMKMEPGVIIGGKYLEHKCHSSRSISYYLLPLLCLAPFAKEPTQITLYGITNGDDEVSVDTIRTVCIPLLEQFGVESMSLKIEARGAPPLGGGKVVFECIPIKNELKPVQLTDVGLIKRIRGLSYCTRVSPQIANRMGEAARGILKQYCPDVYTHSDHFKGKESGDSPGFGITLVAESTTGALISAEWIGGAGVIPEDVGTTAAKHLLQQLLHGGFADTTNQWLMLLFMALCPRDVSKIRLGLLSEYSISLLRLLWDFFAVKFKISTEQDPNSTLLSCMGCGYSNIARKVW